MDVFWLILDRFLFPLLFGLAVAFLLEWLFRGTKKK